MIVVDTNVASELMRADPEPAVRDWVRDHSPRELYVTTITLAEIRYGVERLPDGRRKDLLRRTADDTFTAFADQVLPFDTDAAGQYAAIVVRRDRAGLPIDGFDAQIASICCARAATLATRNLKDFQGTGITLLDPWE